MGLGMDGTTLEERLEYWRRTKRAPGGRIEPGSLRFTPEVSHERGLEGVQMGHHLEHWSGRVDATVERSVPIPLARVNPPSLDRPAERSEP